MWFVKSHNTDRAFYFTPLCTNVVIGRKLDIELCNFSIPDDSSISRKHAKLFLKNGHLVLQDLESTYGTYVNEAKEKLEDVIMLNENDIIKFGKLNSVWKVHIIELVTCTSTLKGENLQTLKVILTKLGGELKSEWDDNCRFLTMPAITLTIKVVLALVHGSYIVTPEFWSKCLEAITNQTILPDPKDFLPQVIESVLNKETVCFLPNQKRKSLFIGKKVIFFSKRQMDMYKLILVASGASVLLITEAHMPKQNFYENDVIVIQYSMNNILQESQVQQTKLNEIKNSLRSKGKRLIPDSEIGLAILHCSLEKHCNPEFNFSSEVLKQTFPPSITNKSPNILAQETQDISEKNICQKFNEKVVDESLSSNHTHTDDVSMGTINADLCLSVKRKLSNDSISESSNAPKKQAIDTSAMGNKDDIFNFIPQDNMASTSDDNKSEKTLNFLKAQKRKIDSDNVEDDLFNFLPDQKATSLTLDKSLNIKPDIEEESMNDVVSQNKRIKLDADQSTSLDILALKGAKLQELKNSVTIGWKSCPHIIKKEEISDNLETKLGELNLGTTVVTVRKYKMVERNTSISPGDTTMNQNVNGKVHNFKKFKKVWPLKMQITLVPDSTPFVNTTNQEILSNA